MNHVCEYCSSTFKKKRNWYEHELVCEIIHKINKQPEDNLEEHLELIDKDNMYKILIHLIKKQTTIEKDLNELKKQTIIKISIIDWINKNLKPKKTINDFLLIICSKINIKVESLLEESIGEFLKFHINNRLLLYRKENKNILEWPIFTYKNKIYVYDSKLDLWKEDNNISEKIYDLLSNILISLLNQWKQEYLNYDETTENDKKDNDDLERKFNLTLLQLVDEKKNNTHIKIIKNIILEEIKCEISTISYQII